MEKGQFLENRLVQKVKSVQNDFWEPSFGISILLFKVSLE